MYTAAVEVAWLAEVGVGVGVRVAANVLEPIAGLFRKGGGGGKRFVNVCENCQPVHVSVFIMHFWGICGTILCVLNKKGHFKAF